MLCGECRLCDQRLQTCYWTWDSSSLGTFTKPLRRFFFWNLRLDSWARSNHKHVRVRRLWDTSHNSFFKHNKQVILPSTTMELPLQSGVCHYWYIVINWETSFNSVKRVSISLMPKEHPNPLGQTRHACLKMFLLTFACIYSLWQSMWITWRVQNFILTTMLHLARVSAWHYSAIMIRDLKVGIERREEPPSTIYIKPRCGHTG